MRHGLSTASAAALLIAASCAAAPATEQKTLPQPSAPRSSKQVPPAPSARALDTTGTISEPAAAPGPAKADSDARRVTGSVGRTLERMEEMFRAAVP
jgi:hypothetical protein